MYAIIGSLVAMIISAISAYFADEIFRRLRKGMVQGKGKKHKKYSNLLQEKLYTIKNASHELDILLGELSSAAKEKEVNIKNLEAGLLDLKKRESDLKDNIKTLENIPIPVIEQFIKSIEPHERRTRKRDYILFFLGVLITTIVSIILNFFIFNK